MSTSSVEHRPTSRWALAATPERVHVAILVVCGLVLLAASTKLWLFYDDWAFLVPSQGDIWAPHVGHWSTSPFLIFLGIRDLFGLGSFVPFAVPVIAAHLLFVHLIWRVMRYAGVDAWIATALSLLLAFFGAGSENILWAFQVGFIGAMDLMLIVFLLMLRPRLSAGWVVLAALLSLWAVTFSGTALPLLGVAIIAGVWRQGWARSAAVFVPTLVGYGVWYLLRGRFADSAGRAEGVQQILRDVPTFMISMLTDGLGRSLPIAVLGPILFAATAIWAVITIKRSSRVERSVYLLFLAAPAFALLTAYSRVGLGLDTATSSRYLYFAIPIMLPLMALGLTKLLGPRIRLGAVLVLLLVVALYNMGGLASSLYKRLQIDTGTRERLTAALHLIEADPGRYSDSLRPYPAWAPDVTVADLRTFERAGWWRGATSGPVAELSMVGTMDVDVARGGGGAETCTVFQPGQGSNKEPDRVVVHADVASSVIVSVADGSTAGDQRSIPVPVGSTTIVLDPPRSSMVLQIASVDHELEVCH